MNEIETTHIYTFLINTYRIKPGKKIFALEGSSGSSKTYSGIDFILEYCRIHCFENKRLTIGRETYKDCIETIAYDFFKRLKTIGWYHIKYHSQSHPQKYNLFGNSVEFTGWSNNGQPSKRQDVLWFNEILESKEDDFKQYNQRTNDVVLADWNPKVTEHWAYDNLLRRKNCYYLHCLMLDNPFLPEGQREELLAYEPTPENIKNGTADDYMYKVYVLGQRTDPKGVIFENVNYIDKWPEDIAPVHGMDFGFTSDPTALVKVGENKTDIFLELLMYEPTETADIINDYAEAKGIDKKIPCQADSSDKYVSENKGTIEMVKDLRKLGWKIQKVSKTKSIMFWLGKMKKKRINVIDSDLEFHFKKEFQNYKLKEVNGISINQPIDNYNHGIDAARYGYMSLHNPAKSSGSVHEFGK